MDKSILTQIPVCYQNKNQLQTFCGDCFIPQNFKKLSLMEPIFK